MRRTWLIRKKGDKGRAVATKERKMEPPNCGADRMPPTEPHWTTEMARIDTTVYTQPVEYKSYTGLGQGPFRGNASITVKPTRERNRFTCHNDPEESLECYRGPYEVKTYFCAVCCLYSHRYDNYGPKEPTCMMTCCGTGVHIRCLHEHFVGRLTNCNLCKDVVKGTLTAEYKSMCPCCQTDCNYIDLRPANSSTLTMMMPTGRVP
jgi:hypothetical protein